MNSVRQLSQSVFRYGVQHFSYDKLDNPEPFILQDFADSNILDTEIKTKTLLLDFRGEGQCNLIISNLIKTIKNKFEATPVVLFNAVVDQTTNIDYEYYCMPAWMTSHCEWFEIFKNQKLDYSVKSKFLCLSRRPSDSRAYLASCLIKSIQDLKLSFGSMAECRGLEKWKPLFVDHDLPLLIDGQINQLVQHNSARNIFSTCMFNIVVESSAQHDPGVWRSIFITEKTFKAFALKQIPLWWAVPGLVTQVRNLGFDVFDDIIDHSYDAVNDQDLRLDKQMIQIKHLDKNFSLNNCNQLRSDLMPRLEKNFDLVWKLCDRQKHDFALIINQL